MARARRALKIRAFGDCYYQVGAHLKALDEGDPFDLEPIESIS